MRRLFKLTRRIGLVLVPACLMAADGDLVIVADSRTLTGIRAWWANLYNENHFYFALLTVLAVPLAGSILGGIADYVIGRLGVDLKSRVLREN